MTKALFLFALVTSFTQLGFSQQPDQEAARRLAAAFAEKRPIAAFNSVWTEEMTWMEIRDAMSGGVDTIIISTGGIEQNGPYVATGKHNYILKSACEMIARDLGNALCAPIIKLVPEGDINPPSSHMLFPGTISLREETFEAVLEDVGSSMNAHGFNNIIYIGDSYGNQKGMKAVAERLNKKWGKKSAFYIPEFYDNESLIAYQKSLGVTEKSEGYHDFYWATAMQMVTDPTTVRYQQRLDANRASINGVSIAPKEKTIEFGKKLLKFRADSTIRAIKTAMENSVNGSQ